MLQLIDQLALAGGKLIQKSVEKCLDDCVEYTYRFMFNDYPTELQSSSKEDESIQVFPSEACRVPYTVLDGILQNLSAADIASARLVCNRWDSIISARRASFARKHIPHLVVHFEKKITSVREKAVVQGFGIFTKPWRKKFPLDLKDAVGHVTVGLLEVRLSELSEAVNELHLDELEAKTVKLRVGSDENNRYLEDILEQLKKNRFIQEVKISKEVSISSPETTLTLLEQKSAALPMSVNIENA